MRYKAKHISKSKQLNKIFSLKSFIILGMICISLTVIPSYAYFTGTSTVTLNGMGVSNLQIQNGTVQLDLTNDGTTLWKNVVATSTPTVGTSSVSITDPFKGQEITYGPVYLNPSYNSSNTNLTSNIDIQTEYIMKKNGGTTEVVNETSGGSFCDPFEVIVGDLDNFNLGAGSYDFYSAISTPTHILDVYPKEYDAQGTDRRMVPTGFYNIAKGFLTKVEGDIQNGLKGPTTDTTKFPTLDYSNPAYHAVKINTNPYSVDGVSFPVGFYVNYDGYTDRAITGKNNAGTVVDQIYDGSKWQYVQKSRPVTFKYTNIPDGQGISSVNFQIFTDDLQSGDAASEIKYYSRKSSSYFRLYLSKKNGVGKVEVTEFAKVLNKYQQSGPKGNIISLNLPDSYFNLVRSAGGLGEGLELIIDDGRLGTSGDAFAIDFAKMTVNKAAAIGNTNSVTVKGKVVDTSATPVPIVGVKVTTGDGQSTLTATDGTYTINNVAPGILSLTFSHYKYKNEMYVHSTEAAAGTTIDLTTTPQVLVKGAKDSITANEKFKVKFTLQKCDGSGNAIVGENPIVLDSKDLNAKGNYVIKNGNGTGTQVLQAQCLAKIQPGFRYKLTYTLTLNSYDDIGDVMPFNLSFSSRIKAKMTQENNPSWGNDGSEAAYGNSLTEYSAATGTVATGTYSDATKTEVYFERPTTSDTYWSTFASLKMPKLTVYNGGTGYSPTGGTENTMVQDTANAGWYKYTYAYHASIPGNSTIKVVDGGNSANTSGYLYYFSTQKVFICTN